MQVSTQQAENLCVLQVVPQILPPAACTSSFRTKAYGCYYIHMYTTTAGRPVLAAARAVQAPQCAPTSADLRCWCRMSWDHAPQQASRCTAAARPPDLRPGPCSVRIAARTYTALAPDFLTGMRCSRPASHAAACCAGRIRSRPTPITRTLPPLNCYAPSCVMTWEVWACLVSAQNKYIKRMQYTRRCKWCTSPATATTTAARSRTASRSASCASCTSRRSWRTWPPSCTAESRRLSAGAERV